MYQQSLDGSDWQLLHPDGRSWPAMVPGCVHTDLLNAQVIPDPWYRDNEAAIAWVHAQDWAYERRFSCDPQLLQAVQDGATVDLVAEGLDTLATISLNGQELARCDNMFRTWRIDISSALQAGDNHLRIDFTSPIPQMRAGDTEHHLPSWNLYHPDFSGKSWLRKMGCAFGWDWGLMAPTAGIWRSLRLECFTCRVQQLRIHQQHDADGVELALHWQLDCDAAQTGRVMVSVSDAANGEEVAAGTAAASAHSLRLAISQPRLWWPNGMGEQALYHVELALWDQHGQELQRCHQRIGLRQLELIREEDTWGESFRFRCNGRDIFSKGANWIPCDIFPSRISTATYDHLLESAAQCHMNMLRVWGGGIYEAPHFYERCDELGILIWQDFMFACSTFPSFDPAFMANVQAEARDAVRALRHHPCLALWCGNNELEQGLVDDQWTHKAMSWEDYKPLFDELLPQVVAEEDGVTPYWPCSPHSPHGDRRQFNNERCGDAHAWSVWFGGQPFEAQRQWQFRFMSEFGFQSFPEPRTVASYTLPKERNLAHWMMDFHQRSGPGNQTIYKYLIEWFPIPKDFASTLWLTQLSQALCITYAAEHARRIQGRMDGLLYWQLNDLWPGATWSSIDVYGRWKALQFLSRRFFAPLSVTIVEERADSSMTIHCSNHLPQAVRGRVHWQLSRCDGSIIREGQSPICDLPSQANTQILVLNCSAERALEQSYRQPLEVRAAPHPPYHSDRDLICWAWLEVDGEEVARSMASFAKPKHLLLSQPQLDITQELAADGSTLQLQLSSDRVAPWTRIELDEDGISLSDNWFHLAPHLPHRITLQPRPGQQLPADIGQRLRVVPLVEHWL